jgi:GPH family glycoside/pentoside/hexuronide:cation symporter
MPYSLVMLATKAASSIAIPLVLLVLQATGYTPNTPIQPDSAVLGIRLVIGPVPALLLFAGIAFAALYPLSRETHRRIVQDLEARRLAARLLAARLLAARAGQAEAPAAALEQELA